MVVNIVATAFLVLAVGGAVAYIARSKKEAKKHGGCSCGCIGCGAKKCGCTHTEEDKAIPKNS